MHLRKGDPLFRKWTKVTHIYFVMRGQIKVDATSANGKSALHETCNPLSWLDEGALDNLRIHNHDATASADSDVIAFEVATFRQLLMANPILADVFITGMARHINIMKDVLDDQLFNAADKRLGRALLALFPDGRDTLTLTTTPTRLAEMISVTRTTANRVIEKFKNAGILKKKEDHYVVHRKPLQVFLLSGMQIDEQET